MSIAVVAAVGSVTVMLAVSAAFQRDTTLRVRSRVAVLTSFFVALALWPLVWMRFVPAERRTGRLLPALLWPLCILTFDIRAIGHTAYGGGSKRSSMTMDANALCSLTFALSGILGTQNDECCRDIFMYAVVGCIAFVMPAPYSSDDSVETVVLESLQKAVLAYATGLLLTGILLMHEQRGSGTVLGAA